MHLRCAWNESDETREFYRRGEFHAEGLILKIAAGGKPTDQEVEQSLNLNRELRRLFEILGAGDQFEFERRYNPLGGWSGYWDRAENEIYLIEKLRIIREVIERDSP